MICVLFLDLYFAKFSERSVETNWTHFKEMISTLTEKYIPLKTIIVNASAPWFNRVLLRLSNKEKRLFRAAKGSLCPVRWQKYDDAAEHYKNAIRDTKFKFFNQVLPSMLQNNPRQFRHVMSCRGRPSVIPLKTADNTQIDKPHCASIFNKVFIKSFSNPFSNTDPTYHVNILSFVDRVIINPNGVSKIINDLK